jgi:hypothetical protein
MTETATALAGATSLLCPRCKSAKLWRDGFRRTIFGDDIQRWLCQECRYRFSDPEDIKKAWSTLEHKKRLERQSLKSGSDIVTTSQVCVTETKNLTAEQEIEVLRRNETGDVQGKIIEYVWWLNKNGKSEATIHGRAKLLRILSKRGANFYDPETVKEVIAKQPWSNGRKNNAVDAYSSFLKMVG